MIGISDTYVEYCDTESEFLRVLEIAVGVVLLILLATMILFVLFAALSGKMCAMMTVMILMTTHESCHVMMTLIMMGV